MLLYYSGPVVHFSHFPFYCTVCCFLFAISFPVSRFSFVVSITLVVQAPVLVRVLGEESGVAGTSYSLTCTVRLPFGIAQFSPNIQWKRPNMPFTPASSISLTIIGFTATLQFPSLQSSDAGEYLCQASYSLGGYTSPLVNYSFILDVMTGKLMKL